MFYVMDSVWIHRLASSDNSINREAIPCAGCGWSLYTHRIAAQAPVENAKRRQRYGNGNRKRFRTKPGDT